MNKKDQEVASLEKESLEDESLAVGRAGGERPLSVDYFGVLAYAMVILTALSQIFLLIWLDLL